ncbi:alpha/beta fold hydrolase [Sinomonas mesophila]|uniref:alpha/beta fold hydrolase n=1 Tax=Sinomonas mesophila TaxID=1531955 RepID=UPI0009856F4A|nr:alpha/beta hydrolase [Sinomonas mesophila]
MDRAWSPDFLGDGVEAAPLGRGPSGPLGILVRYRGPQGAGGDDAGRALVYVHGWSDYFFNLELARFADGLGLRFFALDLPEHGRSIGHGTVPGYVGSAEHYLESVDAAVRAAADESGGSPVLMGHSTGGLAAALFAQRRPGELSGLVLSSPWLVPHGGPVAGRVLEAALQPASARWPRARLPLPPRGYYWRAIAKEAGGEWELRSDLRPRNAFPVRVGWLHGVLEAQRALRSGPRIALPALLLASGASDTGLLWREEMRSRDAVLNVAPMRRAAAALCADLDEAIVEGGLHDVLLSAPAVRSEAYARLGAWLARVARPGPSPG